MKIQKRWFYFLFVVGVILLTGGCSRQRVIIVRSTHPPNAIVLSEKREMLNLGGAIRYNLWHLGRYSGQVEIYKVAYPAYFFQSDTSVVIIQ